MQFTLDPELEKRIEAEVNSGRSAGPKRISQQSDLPYLIARDLGEEYTREEIDSMIDEGLNDLDRGDTIDGEEAFRQLRERSAERRRRGA